MPPLTRVSINFNMAKLGSYAAAETVLKAWKPSGVVCMGSLNADDSGNVVVKMYNLIRTWGGQLIYRHYEPGEDELWKRYPDVRTYLNMLKGFGAPWAMHNVGNEPGPRDQEAVQASRWYAEMLRVNDNEGYNLK